MDNFKVLFKKNNNFGKIFFLINFFLFVRTTKMVKNTIHLRGQAMVIDEELAT